MTFWPATLYQEQGWGWRSALTRDNARRILGLISLVAFSVLVLIFWEEILNLGVYGYPAVFLASLLGNAVLFLPAPSIALVLMAGASLDPILVGLVAGLGAALGEMTGYLAGYSGQMVLQNRPMYDRISGWMASRGVPVIFLLAAIPNPIFDVGGVIAGALRMPAWQFLSATWLGKSLRFALLAGIGVLAAG